MSDSFHVEGAETVYQSHIFRVDKRTIKGHGTEFERDIAVHPGAVGIVAVNDKGEIGMIRQYRSSFDRTVLEIPAGTLDIEGEAPLECAKRELLEELGVTATEWTPLGRTMNSPGWSTQVMHIFEARGIRVGKRAPAGPEEQSAETFWLSPEALRDRLREEPAVDSSTLSALLRVFGSLFDIR